MKCTRTHRSRGIPLLLSEYYRCDIVHNGTFSRGANFVIFSSRSISIKTAKKRTEVEIDNVMLIQVCVHLNKIVFGSLSAL